MRYSNPFIYAALLAPAAMVLMAAPAPRAVGQDGRIEKDIETSYNFQTYLAADPITVQCAKGVVTLTGSVAEAYDKNLAEETAGGIAGVQSVQNDLTVTSETTAAPSDDWITTKVKGVLAFHRNVSARVTKVTTADGMVTLTGEAGSAEQKELTTDYAKDVDGVKGVDNRMTVNGRKRHERLGAKVDDASITAHIKTALLFHRATHTLRTKVATRDGVVVLRGEAASASEKGLVGRLAGNTMGVRRVDNHMTVKPS